MLVDPDAFGKLDSFSSIQRVVTGPHAQSWRCQRLIFHYLAESTYVGTFA